MYQNIEDILEFWFGYFPSEYSSDTSKLDMWFKNGAAYDEAIFLKFGEIYHRAVAGECDTWQEIQRGQPRQIPQLYLLMLFSRYACCHSTAFIVFLLLNDHSTIKIFTYSNLLKKIPQLCMLHFIFICLIL